MYEKFKYLIFYPLLIYSAISCSTAEQPKTEDKTPKGSSELELIMLGKKKSPDDTTKQTSKFLNNVTKERVEEKVNKGYTNNNYDAKAKDIKQQGN